MREQLLRSFCGTLALVLGLGLWAMPPTPATAADHRDGPRMLANTMAYGSLDLNDLYLFVSPTNPDYTVMIITSGGAGVGILSQPFFLPNALFEFRISNDGDPSTDELLFQVVFGPQAMDFSQMFTLVATNVHTGSMQTLATGKTGTNVPVRFGGQVRAGLFDDPFFFDSIAFGKFRTIVQQGHTDPITKMLTGTPSGLLERVAPFLSPSIPNNFFGNFNTLAIVLEVPRFMLQAANNNTHITVWTRSIADVGDGRGIAQFDRTALPAINTAVNFAQPLESLPDQQDIFNSVLPSVDPSLRPGAAMRINLAYRDDSTASIAPTAETLVTILLPDVMPFNTLNRSGFLNGRQLTDDVIDAELNLLTGGALNSDRVINDSVFLTGFPYLGPPLPPGGVPPVLQPPVTTPPGKGKGKGKGKG